MSLQDIKQVLSKIIKLNKNLDENRLNDLLIASGWEKQNKEDALNIFKTEQKKNMANNLAREEHREISTEVKDQELVVVEKNELTTEIKKENIMNFIPANLPIKEEDKREIFIANNKQNNLPAQQVVTEIASVNLEEEVLPEVHAKTNELKQIKLVPLLAVLLIVLLLAFGYMYSHGIM